MRRAPAVVLAAILVVACSGDDDGPPEPDAEETTTTAVVDRSGIALAPVAGETTTTLRETGTARIIGSVRGPAGPVAGATVRVERLVAGRELRADVLTGPDGRFAVERLPGGRYRVRAFQAPGLAQLKPEVRFLADGQEHTFDLVVEDQSGLVVRPVAAPSPALVDDPVNLVVLVATRRVGDDGIVRATPVVGANVELSGLGRWVLRGGDDDGGGSATPLGTTTTTTRSTGAAARTDSAGRVRYELRCEVAGPPGLSLRIPVTVAPTATTAPPTPPPPGETTTTTGPQTRIESVALELAACIDPATTTTASTAPPTSAG